MISSFIRLFYLSSENRVYNVVRGHDRSPNFMVSGDLGALHPNDPNTLYLSTPFDPRDDTDLGVREIFKGVTADHGARGTWTPITQNSVRNNFRPIVPAWDENSTALLWWRGTYLSAQNYDAAVVGIIERATDLLNKMSYVDANPTNTTLATGMPLAVTGPAAGAGAADGRWHERTGFGNGNSIEVFVDDSAIRVGTQNTLVGDNDSLCSAESGSGQGERI